ncbi:hypothetical protein [Actinophytocola gossypii]|uniref:Uncharacterized protein n=1 Tax=Actinophytocola gossypii TaxID=2812003 RepID=A0ABT2J7I7_9PSEU|nr:hypothetical protein [Actinophytocola gossypii]MCT2583254.1 hypothetical protein [Actinophytocola gossypii]
MLENTSLGGSLDWHDGHFAIVSPTVVVTKPGGGGGGGSTATLVYS